MDVIHSEEWTPWCKKGGQTFTQKKRPRNKNTEVFQTHGRQRTLLPLIEVVLLCTFVSFSIFILKVCYLKRALAGEGWGGGRGFMMGWGQRSRGWQRSNRSKGRQPHFWTLVLAAESSICHQMTSCPWPEVTQDSSTAWDHLLIKCVSTHEKNVLFLFVHTHFFPSFFFWLSYTFFGRFVVSKWPVKPEYPLLDTFCDWGGDKDCGNTIERPLGLLCAFLYVCVRMCACMCD